LSTTPITPGGATPEIPLSADARATYEALYATAEAAVKATADPTILGSLNDSKDAIGAVISADNAARLKQDDVSFKDLLKQIGVANDSLKKLAGDIAGVASKIKIFGEVATGINKALSLFPGI
jgi:hypothetical protein